MMNSNHIKFELLNDNNTAKKYEVVDNNTPKFIGLSQPQTQTQPFFQPPQQPQTQPFFQPPQQQPQTQPFFQPPQQQPQTQPFFQPPQQQPQTQPFFQPPQQYTPSASNQSKEQIEFEKLVKEYVQKNKPKLYILTPCFASLCYVDFVSCLMMSVDVIRSLGIEVQVEFCKNDSLVSRARNNLVARAMFDKKMTHIIFIDNDISWEPISILKLLISDKHIIGGAYPIKHYDWSRLIKDQQNPYNSNVIQTWIDNKNKSQLKDIISDNDIIQNKLLKYNVNYLDNYITINNNITKVKHTATGFMMIQRLVFEKMMKAFPSTKYVDDVSFLRPEENEFAYALFDCGVEEGHYFSEDWLFCHRWTKMGGEINIDVTVNLTHTGIENYKGSYITSLI